MIQVDVETMGKIKRMQALLPSTDPNREYRIEDAKELHRLRFEIGAEVKTLIEELCKAEFFHVVAEDVKGLFTDGRPACAIVPTRVAEFMLADTAREVIGPLAPEIGKGEWFYLSADSVRDSGRRPV